MWRVQTHTAVQKHTLSPRPEDPSCSRSDRWHRQQQHWVGWEGQFNGGKGHRSQTVRSVCGLNVSDSHLRAAQGLCSLGRAECSSTSSGLNVSKNFSKIGNAAAWGWRETASCQIVQHSSVFWLTILKGRECWCQQELHLSGSGPNVQVKVFSPSQWSKVFKNFSFQFFFAVILQSGEDKANIGRYQLFQFREILAAKVSRWLFLVTH